VGKVAMPWKSPQPLLSFIKYTLSECDAFEGMSSLMLTSVVFVAGHENG
jgi:hypothetical protein